MRHAFAPLAAALACAAALSASCSEPADGPAEVWTDAPALALAAELFNGSQSRYAVEVRWVDDLALALRAAKRPPAVVAGRYLKGSIVRDAFRPLDFLFARHRVDRDSFYADILALGEADGKQLLMPLSFNLPAVAFEAGAAAPADEFTISLAEMASPSSDFGRGSAGAKGGMASARMGFSPRWDPDFLALAVGSLGAAFRQGKGGLSWSGDGLARALDEVRGWTDRVDGSAAAADDYQFKYLYAPAYQYVREGRALFAYMKSSDLFLIPDDKRSELDFRWFAADGRVPVSDDIVYVAASRDGAGREAGEAFAAWLFSEGSQAAILELSRRSRAMESNFGIAGGFSSMRSVNEKYFAKYYPALLGHMPPAASLSVPAALPEDWRALRKEVLEPWLLEAAASSRPAEDSIADLPKRLAEYRKKGSAAAR
jgi:ABC-type glycerol-3-phosphate transport system substrate-binding protein